MYAPVALFVYNRPRHTRQTVAALQNNVQARNTDLFVFSDMSGKPEVDGAVREVRDYVRSISGFRSVNIVERTKNLGLANSIVDGVTRLCDEFGRVIVLEDDLVTSPHFLEYMNSALERYDGEDRVMQIAGYMFAVRLELEEDALFLPFISSWGWATWRRAWKHFDPHARGYERLLADGALRKQFDLNGAYRYFKMLQAQQQGRVDSWAIRWYLSVFLHRGLALYPKKTLVRNLGFDGSGVNCTVSKFIQDDLDTKFHVSSLPRSIEVSAGIDVVLKSMSAPKLSMSAILNRLAGFLKTRAGEFMARSE